MTSGSVFLFPPLPEAVPVRDLKAMGSTQLKGGTKVAVCFSGEDVHSVWVRDIADIILDRTRSHRRSCPAY